MRKLLIGLIAVPLCACAPDDPEAFERVDDGLRKDAHPDLSELAAALRAADPDDVAIAAATASARAQAAVAALAQIDPEGMMEGEIKALVDDAVANAVNTVPGDITELTPAVYPKYECNTQYGCPFTVTCDSSVCPVTDCGSGACPTCPPWGSNLLIKAWCSYTCMSGSTVTGSAFVAFSNPFNVQLGPYCM